MLIDRFMPVDLDQIATENAAPTAQLVEHLAELGHTRIGMIAGLDGRSRPARSASRAIARGSPRPSLEFDPELVARGDSAAEPARAAAHRLLALERPPTALVVTNNRMTIGVDASAARGIARACRTTLRSSPSTTSSGPTSSTRA